jgi:hypothetical protein
MAKLAINELEQIGITKHADVLDSTVIRMPKSYPAYFGTYTRFEGLRTCLDGTAFSNSAASSFSQKYSAADRDCFGPFSFLQSSDFIPDCDQHISDQHHHQRFDRVPVTGIRVNDVISHGIEKQH